MDTRVDGVSIRIKSTCRDEDGMHYCILDTTEGVEYTITVQNGKAYQSNPELRGSVKERLSPAQKFILQKYNLNIIYPNDSL